MYWLLINAADNVGIIQRSAYLSQDATKHNKQKRLSSRFSVHLSTTDRNTSYAL